MSQSKLEYECTRSCFSKQHASLLTSVITKRSISDAALASFIRHSCQNFLRIVDDQGRSLVHMLASRRRRLLLEWLMQYYIRNPALAGIIDLKDPESGYTAFHRSIFYGQIHAAAILMKNGVNISILDNEEMSGIDLALMDRHPRFTLSKNIQCEVYTWGANTNYTLGTSSQYQRNYPELLASFTKQSIFIKQACMSKFHSVFVSSNGLVWTCGHGEGGRLGVATRDTHVLPTQISLPEPCAQAAIGRDHTLFLLESGNILSCGMNDFDQLGQVAPSHSQLSPRSVKLRLSNILGVCAARYHSAAYNENCLYTWGLNGGQLGHIKDGDKTVPIPRKVTSLNVGQGDSKIKLVSVSDGATVVATSKGDIFLLYQYQCKRIGFRLHNIKTIQVIGGEAIGGDKLTDYQKRIVVLMLNTTGNFYLWQDSTAEFTRCIFNTNRPLFVMETALTKESIFFTTNNGEAFQGNIVQKKATNNKLDSPKVTSPKSKSKNELSKFEPSKNFNQFIDRDDCVLIKLTKLPNIQRAVGISCDGKANNFAVLQVSPNSCLVDLPQITTSKMEADMLTLLNDCSEFDILHDVVIKVDNYIYPAHQYVISHGSDYFKKICLMQGDNKNFGSVDKFTIEIEDIHPLIVKQVLMYLYTGSCDLMVLGPCGIRIDSKIITNDDNNTNNNINAQEDNMKSAFQVYKDSKKKLKPNKKSKEILDDKIASYDPVRQLQAAAKKLGINLLYKLLDKYGWNHNSVIIRNTTNNKSKQAKYKPKFDPKDLEELHDTIIKCSDGKSIKAHRCILAARLEYFNGMFCHSWAENSSYSTITLPIKSKMMNPIIQFLYTDECSEIMECDDFEYLVNILIICDQLFIMRMLEMCEVALSKMITLKNISEIVQISDIYNCPQLKNCCMEYISLNLPTLLESRTIETIPSSILEQVSEYYMNFNPIMSKRIITPYPEAAADEIITSIADKHPINLEDDDMIIETDNILNSAKKKSRTKKSCQSDKKHIEENVSDTLTGKDVHLFLTKPSETTKTEVVDKTWTEVPTAQKKQQKLVQARLKTILDVKENIGLLDNVKDSFTKLTLGGSNTSNKDQNTNIDSEDNSILDLRNSQTALNITVVKKLSQKQRKRLASESKLSESSDLFELTEEKPVMLPIKNPWKTIEEVSTRSVPNTSKVNFSDILEDEKKQRDNLTKMMTKSLALTQLEDRAIEELSKYYRSIVDGDENIAVKRVICTQIASPKWITKTHSNV